MSQQRSPWIVDHVDKDTVDPYWDALAVGTGGLVPQPGLLRCALNPTTNRQYSVSQISGYDGRSRRSFVHRAPLRLTVEAWASHDTADLKGTAGFGFWNVPFVPGGHMVPTLPRAVWFFFGSPPNNMALAKGVPGWGWKAATLDAARWPFLALAPLAPLGFLLMRIPSLYRALWPVGQRAIHASEALLPVSLKDRHRYELLWYPDHVDFRVDGEQVHRAPYAPQGALGFVAWLDNQYAVVTPQGRFKFGLIAADQPQWLALGRIEIQPLS